MFHKKIYFSFYAPWKARIKIKGVFSNTHLKKKEEEGFNEDKGRALNYEDFVKKYLEYSKNLITQLKNPEDDEDVPLEENAMKEEHIHIQEKEKKKVRFFLTEGGDDSENVKREFAKNSKNEILKRPHFKSLIVNFLIF